MIGIIRLKKCKILNCQLNSEKSVRDQYKWLLGMLLTYFVLYTQTEMGRYRRVDYFGGILQPGRVTLIQVCIQPMEIKWFHIALN